MTIWFDMDGTIADLYGVENWLPMIIASDPTPYTVATPLINMNKLARKLNRLQQAGHKIGVISWLSKNSTPEYDKLVIEAKTRWLNKHLRSVSWDIINIVAYGQNKWETCDCEGILFDDEQGNRDKWLNNYAFTPDRIFDILNEME